MTNKLSKNMAPCLMNDELWFDCHGCSQLVVDAFRRPVILFASRPKLARGGIPWIDNEGRAIYTKDSTIFVPFIEMDSETSRDDPIILLYILIVISTWWSKKPTRNERLR